MLVKVVKNIQHNVRLDSLSLEVLSYSQIDYRRLFVPFCGCLGAVGVGLLSDIRGAVRSSTPVKYGGVGQKHLGTLVLDKTPD